MCSLPRNIDASVGCTEYFQAFLKKGFACLREVHAPGVSLKKCNVQCVFQLFDALAQRRLSNMQSFGSFPEVKLLFCVQVARSEQMLNPKLGNSGISAQDVKELRQLLALHSEAFELRE